MYTVLFDHQLKKFIGFYQNNIVIAKRRSVKVLFFRLKNNETIYKNICNVIVKKNIQEADNFLDFAIETKSLSFYNRPLSKQFLFQNLNQTKI